MKRSLIHSSIILLVTTMLILSGCASGEEGGAQTGNVSAEGKKVKIRIADTASNPTFRVGIEKGFFAEQGIDAESMIFGTPAEGVNALFINQIDIAYGADFPVLNALSKGDYSVIASAGQATDYAAASWKLYVSNDIQAAADLKGKKVSFLRGTFIPYLWDEYLKENGVALQDVTQVGQGSFDETYIALKQGDLDAAWVVGSALTDKFDALDNVHQLSDMSKTSVRLGMGLVASDAFISENPEIIGGFLKALNQASEYAQAHPEEVADLQYKLTKQPKEATLKDIPINPWVVGFTQAAFDSLAKQKQYMVDNGIIQQDFDLASKLKLEPLSKVLPDQVTFDK
ncbi:NitT/TauT family transport system substrate-binding protein [Paenibacillus amylolyticus]|uniref:NitT/TauT family transport system substrate-binding protein n=1 Tax=Paenibacillus amylolyticus TaxID=1451 RepID=A0AAP5LR08_PAEAM|nr:NitT/TauT family transport system substrate-binding protein [Paenibacillus amylolyticus]